MTAGVVVFGLAGTASLSGAVAGAASTPINVSQRWVDNLDRYSLPSTIAQSSPVIAHLAGTPEAPKADVVVGDRGGNLFALDLATGDAVGGSPVLRHVGLPIDSAPSSIRNGADPFDTVYVGLGSRAVACSSAGGYLAVNHDGTTRWRAIANNPDTDTACLHNTVMAGLTIANLLSGVAVAIAPSLGQGQMAFKAKNGKPVVGWNFWYQADSSVSTPAVAKLDGASGPLSVIEGGDSTAGLSYGVTYRNGGHIRIIANTGNGGTLGPGGTRCSYDTYANGGQIVESSPAVGHILSNGGIGIASGMGYYPDPAYRGSSNTIFVINKRCQLVWSKELDHETGSPIIADVTGTGSLAVIVATQGVSRNGDTEQGTLYAFDAATGKKLWKVATGAVIGSPVAADLTGKGYADVVVASASAWGANGGLQIIDGTTGEKVWREELGIVGQNSPLITADPNGHIGITIAGYKGETYGTGACRMSFCLASTVAHFEVTGSSATWLDNPATSWLQFHHDAQLSGNVDGPTG